MCDRHATVTKVSPSMPAQRARSDSVRVGLIGGAGILAGAIMGAISMFALLDRDRRRAAAARPAPAVDTPPASPAPPQPRSPALPPRSGLVGWDERGAYYIVQAGDYGAKIAALFPGADVRSLVKANPDIREWRAVQPGTRLRLPEEWIFPTPAESDAVPNL